MFSQSEMDRAFSRAARRAAKEVSKMRSEKVYQAIYRTPNKSGKYDRTGGFLRSIKFPIIEEDANSIDIYRNRNETRPHNGTRARNRFGGWNMITFGHYRSWPWESPYPDDSDVQDNLYEWLNDGFHIFKKSYHGGFDFDEDWDYIFSNLVGTYMAEELYK